MLRSDSTKHSFMVDNIVDNISSINIDTVAKIENELVPYDLISLVFLLYDTPDTALQKLLVYQRVSKDDGDKNMNLLYDWARYAHSQITWQYEFLEALAVCQLYSVIHKLGFNVQSVKNHYLPNNIQANVYINPLKKALYKICEHMTAEKLDKLKNTLKTYDINTYEYEACELIILDLMCKKFIVIGNVNSKTSDTKYNINDLAKILHNLPGLQDFADKLTDIQSRLNNEHDKAILKPHNDSEVKECEDSKSTPSDIHEIFEQFNQMCLEESSLLNLKSDTKRHIHDAYPIKNPKRVGVCYIINQEDFHPSKQSIESGRQSQPLEKRLGSNRDKTVLENTMTALNYEVISHQNIGSRDMIDKIKHIVQFRVQPDHSIFMLCILSHGVKGHVYAADSVKVDTDEIENLLDDSFMKRNLEIPKVLIIQACRVNVSEIDSTQINLVADSPCNYMKKSDLLICWATAPELEAYREEKVGSIFIQMLCLLIRKYAQKEHLYDIFTKVTNGVAKLCKLKNKDQVPSLYSTLRKKLYLQIPE